MKAIKKFIVEIIVLLALIAVAVVFVTYTNKLHSNSVYDGNYVGGNSTKAYANVDVKWIASLEDTPGVDKVVINESSNWGAFEQDEFLKEEGWYLISYEVKVNMPDGYFERNVENLLVSDIWNANNKYLYFIEVEDGIGSVTKIIDSMEQSGEDNEIVYPSSCDIHFSNNGAVISVSDYDMITSLYLEKNGTLTAYNYQIIQSCLIGAFALICLGYIVYAFKKNKVINIAVVFVIVSAMFLYSYNAIRDNSIGEWRSIENDDVFVLYPKREENQYIKIMGDATNSVRIYRMYQEQYSEEFDPRNKEFLDEYERFDLIPGYFSYPFILCLDIVVSLALGFLGFSTYKNKKGTEGILVQSNWNYPYGEYNITKIKYLSDAFKGMEDYFMNNLSECKVKFMPTVFAFEDVEIENPKYVDECKKISLYGDEAEEKMHVLTIMDSEDETEYDICVAKKGMYLRKKMENEIIIVYEI